MKEITDWSNTAISELLMPGVQRTQRVKGSVPFPWKGQLVSVGYDIEVVKTFRIGDMQFQFPKEMGPMLDDGSLPPELVEANDEVIWLVADDVWKVVLSAEDVSDTSQT